MSSTFSIFSIFLFYYFLNDLAKAISKAKTKDTIKKFNHAGVTENKVLTLVIIEYKFKIQPLTAGTNNTTKSSNIHIQRFINQEMPILCEGDKE